MSAITDKAAAVKAALQDYARDIEADLGKQARALTANPNWEFVQPFNDVGPTLAAYQADRARYSPYPHRLSHYQRNAAGARDAILRVGAPETTAERTAYAEILALLDSINTIRTHPDAVALVATF